MLRLGVVLGVPKNNARKNVFEKYFIEIFECQVSRLSPFHCGSEVLGHIKNLQHTVQVTRRSLVVQTIFICSLCAPNRTHFKITSISPPLMTTPFSAAFRKVSFSDDLYFLFTFESCVQVTDRVSSFRKLTRITRKFLDFQSVCLPYSDIGCFSSGLNGHNVRIHITKRPHS